MTPLFSAGAALLVVAGGAKAWRPVPARDALAGLGLRLPAGVVRFLAVVEAVVGMAGVLAGGRLPAALVAAAYATFVAFSVAALVRGGVQSCGCFGRVDTPVGGLHVLLSAGGLAAAIAASVRPARGVVAALAAPAGAEVLGLCFAGLTVWLAYAALTLLPPLEARP